MSTPTRTPVRPWIPQRKAPRSVVVVVRPKAPSPGPVLRAGWLVAILSGILMGAAPAIGLIPLLGAFYLILFLLPYPAGIAILALSIVAMTRGAAARGLLLLLGGPAVAMILYWGTMLLTFAIIGRR